MEKYTAYLVCYCDVIEGRSLFSKCSKKSDAFDSFKDVYTDEYRPASSRASLIQIDFCFETGSIESMSDITGDAIDYVEANK